MTAPTKTAEVDIEEDLSRSSVRWFRRRISEWASLNLRAFDWRNTSDPYAIVVAEFLLQQTDAPRVMPVYRQFLEKYPNIDALAAAPLADVVEVVKPLGFHFRAQLVGRVRKLASAVQTSPESG